MKNQTCSHPFFYTISKRVYCNECHKVLGYFNFEGKIRGFFKQTTDSIEDEYLNQKTVSEDRT